jgi:hypothetical protein
MSIDVRVLVPSKVTDSSAVAPLNALDPIDVTLAGMVMEVSEVAVWNMWAGIDLRVLVPSKVTEVSAVKSRNAWFPINLTLAGMVMEASLVAP